MVRLTDSEVDCVINAARPLDGSARDAFLREVASCAGIGDDVVHRVVAESRRDIFGHLNLAPDKPETLGSQVPLNWSISLGRRRIRKVATAPTRFAAEAETFRTRSLGERARK